MMVSASRVVPRRRLPATDVFHPIQIRAFRFGAWASCLDPVFHRALRRRHRALKPKYVDGIERVLSWHEHSLSEEHRLALKRAFDGLETPTTTTPRVNKDEPSNPKTASPQPPRANHNFATEYVDPRLTRAHLEPVIERMHMRYRAPPDIKTQNAMKTSELPFVNCTTENSGASKAARNKTDSTVQQDFVIDPITNRKVPRKQDGPAREHLEPPTTTFKTYRSQFSPFAPPSLEPESLPVYSNDKRLASELNKYADIKLDDWPKTDTLASYDSARSLSHPETSAQVTDNPTPNSEEYALNHLPLEDPVEDHDGPHEYPTTAPIKSTLKSPSSSKYHDVVDKTDSQGVSQLGSYQSFSKPDQLQSELQKYGPYMHNEEPLIHRTTRASKDAETSRATELPGLSTTFDDIQKYKNIGLHDFKDQDQPFEQYGDLEKYKAFRLEHMDIAAAEEKDVVEESLKEYDDKVEESRNPDSIYGGICGVSRTVPRMKLPEGHVFSQQCQPWTKAGATDLAEEKSQESLHQQMDELITEIDAMDRQINSGLEKTRAKFTGSGGTDAAGISTGDRPCNFPVPSGLSSVVKDVFMGNAPDHPRYGSRLEPALTRNRRMSAMKGNRINLAFGGDLYSKEPQGLETSFSEECGGSHTMPLYRRTYGSEPGHVASASKLTAENEPQGPSDQSSDLYYHRDPEIDGIPRSGPPDGASNRSAAQPNEPTVYKILAYDQTMQTVEIAETSSVVPDLASPLSPTEVLPRLSNPTKFFPHFAALQAEGFEIVSGSGDVLVFRQIRPAKTAAQGGAMYVNPIDLMGSSAAVPNAAAFVSPTGFVNYDIPLADESTNGASQSNTNRRQEGPKLGGQKSSSGNDKGKKPRMHVAKRVIIGGTWVAGFSYALGVVSEYFSTGGTEGKGPSGFSPQ
ncbi:hypothetical protein F4802DRAFT_556444 [Xylaria palmicola]|nr:hypothetical protein F4802DRAFT_556444 [Xylaria palmicola]